MRFNSLEYPLYYIPPNNPLHYHLQNVLRSFNAKLRSFSLVVVLLNRYSCVFIASIGDTFVKIKKFLAFLTVLAITTFLTCFWCFNYFQKHILLCNLQKGDFRRASSQIQYILDQLDTYHTSPKPHRPKINAAGL